VHTGLGGSLDIRGQHDPAALGQRAGDDLAAPQVFHLPGDLPLHRLGQRPAGGEQDGRCQRVVLGLRQQVGRHPGRAGALVGHHHPHGRPGQPLQPPPPVDLLLG